MAELVFDDLTLLGGTLFDDLQGSSAPAPSFSGTLSIENPVVGAPITPIATAGYFASILPLTFSFVGSWPAWASINSSTGLITGTPTAPASFSGLKVRATSTAGFAESNEVAFDVIAFNAIPTHTGPVLLGPFEKDVAIEPPVDVSVYFDDDEPLTITTSGSYPPGLSVSPEGLLTGTPTAAGTFLGLRLIATDSIGQSVQSDLFAIGIAPSIDDENIPPTFIGPAFTPVFLPFGQAITPINVASLFLDAGDAITVTLSGDALPLGLSFAGGQIVGTPQHLGEFTVVATATDSQGAATSSNALLITVAPVNASTYRDVIRRALRQAGALAYGNTPSAELVDGALALLVDMLEEWRDNGLDIGANLEGITADSPYGADAGTRRAVILNLAVEIANDVGLPLAPSIITMASESRGNLAGRLMGLQLSQVDPGLLPRSGRYDIDRDI